MSNAPQNYVALHVVETGAASIAGDFGIDFTHGEYSILAWVQFNALTSGSAIVEREGEFLLRAKDFGFFFQIDGCPPLSWTSREPLGPGWHSVCVTFADGTARLFVDGKYKSLASVGTSGAQSGKPLVLGSGLQGLLRRVVLFNTALDSQQVLTAQFEDLDSSLVAADFDFATNPPVDKGPGQHAITLRGGAHPVAVTPALSLNSAAYAKPRQDDEVNPGGFQTDPYTVQAWVLVGRPNPRQTLFANSDLDSDTGIALALVYDSEAKAFALESSRGSRQGGEHVTSEATIPLHTWVNVATTFDGRTLEVFVNGESAGRKTCGPIPLSRPYGDVVLGGTFDAISPGGVETLQGALARLEVWDRALSAAEVRKFQGEEPGFEASGLTASYPLGQSPCRNQVNGHPVGLVDGAAIGNHLALAPEGSERLARRRPQSPTIDEAQLAEWRAAIDHRPFLETLGPQLELACAADVARLDNPADAEQVQAAYHDVLQRLEAGGDQTPFTVTEHVLRDRLFWVAHSPRGSWVAFETHRDAVSDCTLWKVKLVFVIVAGALDAICGLSAKLDDKAISLIRRILENAEIASLLSRGKAMSAFFIFVLMGNLYQGGFLRPLIGLIVDLGLWSLIRVVARLGLTFLGVGSASVLASLAATVVVFLKTYSERPESCDPLPKVTLSAIRFAWDPTGTAIDGLNLRRNAQDSMDGPSWERGHTEASQSPVAYAIDRVRNKSIQIQVRLDLDTTDTTNVKIRATGGGILGPIRPVTVHFVDGDSHPEYRTFALKDHKVAHGGVQAVDAEWTWQYKLTGGDWTDLATSKHRVYALLSAPTMPWQLRADPDDTQLPWTAALELACRWAAGKTSPSQALTAITTQVNDKLGLQYNSSNGDSLYTDKKSPSGWTFLLSKFLELLAGKPALGKKVNCTDTASIVTTFSNLVGCDVQASVMGFYRFGGGFETNKIQAIGSDDWAYPFQHDPDLKGRFLYHEVVWSSRERDPVYDACLKVDSSNDPWNWEAGSHHTPKLPVGMVFTKQDLPIELPIATPFEDQTYRERLATNTPDGIGSCDPAGQFPNTQNGRRRVV